MTKGKRRVGDKKKLVYEILSVAVLCGLVVLGGFTTQEAFIRFFEAIRDLGISSAYLFNDAVVPSVTSFSVTTAEEYPRIIGNIQETAGAFLERLISLENLAGYRVWLGVAAHWLLVILVIILSLAILFAVCVYAQTRKRNCNHSELSAPLKGAIMLYATIYLPVKHFLLTWGRFLKEHAGYRRAIVCVICFYLNVFTVGIEAIAYYFYFIFSYDLLGLLVQFAKLLWDIALGFRFLPLWLWIPVWIWAFDRIRRKIAFAKLDRLEAKLRDFIRERAVVFMICAPMREGKTTLLTSIMMSLEKMYRADADEELFKIRMRFPNFPWQRFQYFIARGMKRHKIYNLAGTRAVINLMGRTHGADAAVKRPFLRWIRKEFGLSSTQMPDMLFGYNTELFPAAYRDDLTEEDIFHAMRDYAQLYFIYRCPSSLIVSNYNIRLDNDFEDAGNYPRWRDDFFDPEPAKSTLNAHVLNQDMLRLGKRKNPSGAFNDALEFGAIAQTEIGKERGNQFDHRGQSQKDEACNQTNDFYDANLKMWGHSATIRFIPFSRFGCDEQRPESWSANARELADIITITDKSAGKILLPFFAAEEAVYLFSTWFIRKLFRHYDFNRGDVTLTMWIMLMLYSVIYNHYIRTENTFGGYYNSVFVESGMKVNGGNDACKTEKLKLFVSRKKVYSDRFDTAAWRTFYEEKAKRSAYGINDIETYSSLEVTKQEMKDANSHFFDMVMKLFKGEDGNKASDGKKEPQNPTQHE